MKKKIIFIILLGVLLCILFLIPKETYQKIFNRSSKPSENNYKENILVYMQNEENQIIGVNAYVDSIEEDQISQKFDIITKKTGVFKQPVNTCINSNTSLINHEENNGCLTLNVSEDFDSSLGRRALEQLVWTFCDDEIKEVKIKINGNQVNKVNDYYFTKLTKDFGINLTKETNYLFEASTTTIIRYISDYVLPVTYFYKDKSVYDFMVTKLFVDKPENITDYDYTISASTFELNFNKNVNLDDNLKRSIEETIKYNLQVDKVTIHGLNSVLLEIDNTTKR